MSAVVFAGMAWCNTPMKSFASSTQDDASKDQLTVSTIDDVTSNESDNLKPEEEFISAGYTRYEMTNSIIASKDTNISPGEVYEIIQSKFMFDPIQSARNEKRIPRVLDVGCGAGVSTQTLWKMGYKDIQAIDWSAAAWDRYVTDDPTARCPPSVKFYEVDDERYRAMWRSKNLPKFDAVVFNFAVNDAKAKSFAKEMLAENGRLLAPVNERNDYWLKQAFRCYDTKGDIVFSGASDIGAWSVQFQPDVTQDTCQGIWCSQYNGFQKMKK
uniref:Methyltransferase domain-containing protein n=1 Tax=Proboscia inermis TaxID=420281 RepID=A0A7S0BZW0_9STRA